MKAAPPGDGAAADRDAPTDLDAERHFLGALLLDGTLLARATEEAGELESGDFAYASHQLIYAAIQLRATDSDDFNPMAICDILENRGELGRAGGRGYVLSLSNLISPASAIADYARIIRSKSRRRQLLQAATSISSMCLAPEGRSVDEIYDEAQHLIFSLVQASAIHEQGPQPVLPEIVRLLDEIGNQTFQELASGVPTGFVRLDNLTHGLQPGSLNIIAARPSMGKTSFAMNIVTNIAINPEVEYPALVFSLEMPLEQLVLRMISSFGRISVDDMLEGRVTPEQWPRIMQKVALLAMTAPDGTQHNKLYIDDSADLTPLQLRSRARQLHAEFGGLSVIMVDYVQLMRSQTRAASRTLEVGEISRSLKLLAKDLQVPVLLLSQLNREVESRRDHRPMNSDLRDSGSLEQDADLVLFLHREYVYTNNEEDRGQALLIVGKNRNGATDDIRLQFQGEYTTFYDEGDTGAMSDGIPLSAPYQ